MPAWSRIPSSVLPRIYTGEEVLTMPEPDWLLTDFIQKGGLTLVYGEPGGGKSLVMQDWANVLAAPGDNWFWMGRKRLRQANVLYIMGEGQGGLRGRLLAWKKHRNMNTLPQVSWIMEPVHLWRPASDPVLTPPQVALIQLVKDENYDVMFLDTLAATYGAGNENTQQDMNQYLQVCAEIQRLGCAIVIAHHNSKGSKTLRGSTVLMGAADTVIFLDPTFDKEDHRLQVVKLVAKKQKDGIPFSPVLLAPKIHDVDTKVGQSLTLSYMDFSEEESPKQVVRREKIMKAVQMNPGISAHIVRKTVGGKTTLVAENLKWLVRDGQLVRRRNDFDDDSLTYGYYVVEAEEVETL